MIIIIIIIIIITGRRLQALRAEHPAAFEYEPLWRPGLYLLTHKFKSICLINIYYGVL